MVFEIDFTLLNASSMGLKSGLYGGRNKSNIPASSNILFTSFTWCMVQLSRTAMDLEELPSKGCMLGIKDPRTKPRNLFPSTEPVVSSTSTRPCVHMAAIADILLPLARNLWYTGVSPMIEYPNLRMFALASERLNTLAARYCTHLCFATCWTFLHLVTLCRQLTLTCIHLLRQRSAGLTHAGTSKDYLQPIQGLVPHDVHRVFAYCAYPLLQLERHHLSLQTSCRYDVLCCKRSANA